MVENRPVKEHQSNGTSDVTNASDEECVGRERLKAEVPSRHPILAFVVEHAGRLMSRCQVGRGRTAYDVYAGKPFRRQLVDFGERLYFMPIRPGGARQAQSDAKWHDGDFVGIRDRSDEMLTMMWSV